VTNLRLKKLGTLFENQVRGRDNKILHQTTHHVFTCANHVFAFVNIIAKGYSHTCAMAYFLMLKHVRNMLD
jgi:hypothetical protein